MSDLRSIPSVDKLLRQVAAEHLIGEYGRPLTLEAIRQTLEDARNRRDLPREEWTEEIFLENAEKKLADWLIPTLKPVINATGVILHTNLGRAPFNPWIVDTASLAGYSSLEYDLDEGERGSRSDHAERLLTRLTGAEAALVVNNNAAAVMLVLTALCKRKRVIISRTQLVEIGGGFRVPEVLAQSGAKMVEIGTTNRVHPSDYEEAFQEGAGAILRAHHSNYRLTGFTSEPSLKELGNITRSNEALLIDDLGSGALLDTAKFGLAHEPMVQESLADGADLVCFSADKLLGGPQAGIILGKTGLIAKIKKHPLARAVRIDKLNLAVLCRVLDLYLRDKTLEIPVWNMIARSEADLEKTALRWQKFLGTGEIVEGLSTIGGGSLPGETLPTRLLSLKMAKLEKALSQLRANDPPIIARIERDRIVCDPRTVFPQEEESLLAGLRRILS